MECVHRVIPTATWRPAAKDPQRQTATSAETRRSCSTALASTTAPPPRTCLTMRRAIIAAGCAECASATDPCQRTASLALPKCTLMVVASANRATNFAAQVGATARRRQIATTAPTGFYHITARAKAMAVLPIPT